MSGDICDWLAEEEAAAEQWGGLGGAQFYREQFAAARTEIERLRAEVERLSADPTIYKHQCGHCSRFSPLPFLIPGYLIGGPS